MSLFDHPALRKRMSSLAASTTLNARPFEFEVVSNDWDESARQMIEVISCEGYFRYDSLEEALESGPYDSSRDFVLAHLHYITVHAKCYGAHDAKFFYYSRMR